jgi:murein endopeptidase
VRRRTARAALLALFAAAPTPAAAPGRAPLDGPPVPPAAPVPALPAPPSVAAGAPWDGRLRHGVLLPAWGPGFVTWDAVLHRAPNRAWRRWGTDRLVATLQDVAALWALDHPGAPPLLVEDLSRRRGGPFGERFGGLGHASHQNGLDADVSYPRRDGLVRAPWKPSQVDRPAAQELVDRFVAAGAQKVFVGPRLRLRGPRRVVVPLVHHDDHLHVRLPPAPRT